MVLRFGRNPACPPEALAKAGSATKKNTELVSVFFFALSEVEGQ